VGVRGIEPTWRTLKVLAAHDSPCTTSDVAQQSGSPSHTEYANFKNIAEDLQRWEAKLAKGLPGTLKRGEFRRDESGQIWETQRKAKGGEERVPAEKYTEHPNTGGLRRAGEAGSLPSLRGGNAHARPLELDEVLLARLPHLLGCIG